MLIQTISRVRLTNFGRAGVSVEKHAAAIWCHSSTIAGQEARSHGLARFHSLKRQVSSHRLRNVVAVVAVLDALLGNVLYLSAPSRLSVFGQCRSKPFAVPVLEPDLHRSLSHVDF
jgi:hypothetical protein